MKSELEIIEKEFEAFKKLLSPADFDKLVINSEIVFSTKKQTARIETKLSILNELLKQSAK